MLQAASATVFEPCAFGSIKQIIMKMPNEITIRERHCTLDMYNDRGSSRLLDITTEGTADLIAFDLDAVHGELDIKAGERTYKLSEYQVKALVQFLSQRD